MGGYERWGNQGDALNDVCSFQMLERYAQCTSRSRIHHGTSQSSLLQREKVLMLHTLRIFKLHSYPTAHAKARDGIPAVTLHRGRRRRLR